MHHPTEPTATKRLSLDESLALLADPHRRAILAFCRDHDGTPVSLERLVSGVICTLSDDLERDLNPMDLRVECHHVHLPQLTTAGVLEYDPATATVHRYRGDPRLEALLGTVEDVA